MEANTVIIVYVFAILIQIGVIFLKPKIIVALPIIIVSICYIFTKEDNLFILCLIQCLIAFLGLLTFYIVNSLIAKKKNSSIDKTKIKDL